MQIKGTKYKVDKVDDLTGSTAPQTAEEKQVQDENFLDFFMGSDGSTLSAANTKNSDPINDYMFGQYKGDVKQTNGIDDGGAWLEDFPPTIEELVMKNQSVASNLDIAVEKYEKAQSDLLALAENYEAALYSGEMGVTETKDIQHRLDLVEKALAKCQGELDKIAKLSGSQEAIYLQETKTWKDLNNDNWIGKPGNIACINNKDGTITYMDAKSKTVIAAPFSDLNYSPKIAEGGLEKIEDKTKALNASDAEGVDIYLKLTEAALSKSGKLNSKIELGIPESLWVLKKQSSSTKDGNTTNDPYETYYDEKSSGLKMKIYDQWDNSNGLVQKVPSDPSNYVQVQVTKVAIKSEECGLKDNKGKPLYNHFIEYYNGSDLITRIRIEGLVADSSVYTCTLDDNTAYVAASSVSITLDGSGRANPCEIDAEEFISTGFTSIDADKLENVLGISKPDNKKGKDSYNAVLAKFKGKTGYVAADSTAEKSGLNIINTRGKITGTSFNDIIKTNGVNEYSDYAKEHMAENTKKIAKDDPFYYNCVDGNLGSNIIVTGKGDDRIFNATFYWGKGASNDEKYVATPDVVLKDNQANFVYGEGGKYYIFKPDETNLTALNKVKDDAGWDAELEKQSNDYYEIASGVGHYANFYLTDYDGEKYKDPDIFGNADGEDALDIKEMETDTLDVMGKWENQLTKVPEVDEQAALASLDEIMKSSNELTTEMDSFFNEYMGETDEFANEFEGTEEKV